MKSHQLKLGFLVVLSVFLTACSSGNSAKKNSKGVYRNQTTVSAKATSSSKSTKQNTVIANLQKQHQRWKGTRYRLGGTTRSGVDCSGFTQVTYRDLFGITLPRMTTDQAKVGKKVSKNSLKAGDLVFFKTGRGPNGKHVGIYVKDGQFLHASSKAGVTYSSLSNPYWAKVYWQARRM